jgi:hypothetical protein
MARIPIQHLVLSVGKTLVIFVFCLFHSLLLVVLKPNRIIYKRTYVNCSSFHLRVFLGSSNPQGQRQTSILSIPCDNFGERKDKFNLGTSRITQM